MRVYLSGPMTGCPDWNYPAFHAAAERLRKLGHTVYNPADSAKDTERTSKAEFLRDDLALIAGFALKAYRAFSSGEVLTEYHYPADAICLLPGWERSAGARMELHVALELGLTVFEETLPDRVIVTRFAGAVRAQLLDAVVSAWAPKGIELVDTAPIKSIIDDTVAAIKHARSGDGASTISGVGAVKAPESAAQEAHRLVHGNRGADYGHPLDDFTRTAGMWTAAFADLLKAGAKFTHREVWQGMVMLKLSRERNHPKRDSRVDIAGYAETGQMCEDEAARRAAA